MISNRNRRLSVSAILFFTLCLLSRSVSATEVAQNKDDLYSLAHIDSSNLSIYGKVKVDLIYDLEAPSGDRINYTTIPTDDSNAHGQSRVHARESRIGVKYKNEIYGKELSAVIEGDFYGGGTNSPSGSEKISNSVSFRLRQAYISYNHWVVGQTWSNYVDVKSFPETLDFSNETGQAFIRQGQIRFHHKINNFHLSYSLENPETDVYILEDMFQEGTEFQTVDPILDLTAKARYQASWGHLSLQVVSRKQEIHVNANSVSETSYGIGGSGKIGLTSDDTLKFHYSQGDGIGRYIQEAAGSSGLVIQSSLDSQNETPILTLLHAKGGYLSYQHRINKTFRMNVSSGFIDIDYSSMSEHALVANRTQSLTSVHGNIIWSVIPNLEIGVEHSIARLKTVAGDKGTIKRFQLSATFRF